jgi:hypothetical protein
MNERDDQPVVTNPHIEEHDMTTATVSTRKDLGAHIVEAFADLEVGQFMTCAQIGNVSTTVYGDEKPSVGAIVARLFPASGTCTVPGIRPCLSPDNGARGAVKVVEFTVDGQRWQTGPVNPVA